MSMRTTHPLSCLGLAVVASLFLCQCGVAGALDASAPTNSAVPADLTLTQAVAIALAHNPEIAAVRFDETAAQEQYRQAVGTALPSLRAEGGYNRFLDNQRLIPARESNEPGVFTKDLFSGNLVFTQPLFTGGRMQNEIRAADLLRQAAGHQLVRSREELVFDVSSLYCSILASRHVVASLEFSQKALAEHLKQVEALIAAEKTTRVDQLRVDVRLADLRQKTIQAGNTERVQKCALIALMGGMTQPDDLRVGGELAVPSPTVSVSVDVALAKAMQQRPDYLAARSSFAAQDKALAAARAAHWPTVALEADYGGRWAVDPSEHPTGTRAVEDVGWIGVVIDVPLFEGGRIDARVKEQQARLAASQERLRKLKLQVRLDVETAVLNLASSHERTLATRKVIEQAEESLRIEQTKYDVGRGAIADVLDAQTALLESQTSYYRALADYNTADAQLRLATGEDL
jgi:outer membrane protein TolC